MKFSEELQFVWRYLTKYRKKVYFLTALSVAGAAITAAIPFLYGKLVDRVIAGSTLEVIGAFLGLWFLLSATNDFIDRIVGTKGEYIAIDAGTDLLLDLASHVVELPLQFHRTKRLGRIGRQVDRAGTALERLISSLGFGFLPELLMFLAALAAMAWIEWRVALIAFVVAGIYFLLTRWRVRNVIASLIISV